VSTNPAEVIPDLFGPPKPSSPPPTPPPPTLHQRLLSRRPSILDAVAKEYTALEKQVNPADRARLEAHASFLQTMILRSSQGSGATQPTSTCTRPDENKVFVPPDDNDRGQYDGQTTPYQVENMVQALACDITRVAGYAFQCDYAPLFPSAFPNGEPANLLADNWHNILHGNPQVTDSDVPMLTAAYQFFGNTFTSIVQRLDQMLDVDGGSMLNNTLVVWVTEMGYANHNYFNIPVVLAGMPSAFAKGQGRHVVMSSGNVRHTLGDLWAQVIRMVGAGSDTTFGETGTLGSLSSDDLIADAGLPGYITKSTPLHAGALDL
jgi:hypothetical protein